MGFQPRGGGGGEEGGTPMIFAMGGRDFVVCLRRLIIDHVSLGDGARFLIVIDTPSTFWRS